MKISADTYLNEPVRYPALKIVNLKDESSEITENYSNTVINRVNDSCLRLSVLQEQYPWHYHPVSDELFIVVEGELIVELEDGQEFRLRSWESVTVPAETIHRTRANGRTVTLCFEELKTETVFLEPTE